MQPLTAVENTRLSLSIPLGQILKSARLLPTMLLNLSRTSSVLSTLKTATFSRFRHSPRTPTAFGRMVLPNMRSAVFRLSFPNGMQRTVSSVTSVPTSVRTLLSVRSCLLPTSSLPLHSRRVRPLLLSENRLQVWHSLKSLTTSTASVAVTASMSVRARRV